MLGGSEANDVSSKGRLAVHFDAVIISIVYCRVRSTACMVVLILMAELAKGRLVIHTTPA